MREDADCTAQDTVLTATGRVKNSPSNKNSLGRHQGPASRTSWTGLPLGVLAQTVCACGRGTKLLDDDDRQKETDMPEVARSTTEIKAGQQNWNHVCVKSVWMRLCVGIVGACRPVYVVLLFLLHLRCQDDTHEICRVARRSASHRIMATAWQQQVAGPP